jgi:hypothetical protein
LIEDFPFVSDADRSVALSAILTALDRHAMASTRGFRASLLASHATVANF